MFLLHKREQRCRHAPVNECGTAILPEPGVIERVFLRRQARRVLGEDDSHSLHALRAQRGERCRTEKRENGAQAVGEKVSDYLKLSVSSK